MTYLAPFLGGEPFCYNPLIMITGKKLTRIPSDKELYALTSGGKDIYIKYLGRLSKSAMKRPWGEDNHPSWGVWQAPDGVWMWKDMAADESGNPIQFVQRMFKLSFSDAMRKILSDLGLGDKVDISSDVVMEEREGVAVEPTYAHITAKIRKFGPRHHAFWNAVDVTEDWCKKFDCYAVKEAAINRRKIKINDDEMVFVYLARDINKVKLYFPDREHAGRFRNNVPFHYLWNCNKITTPCSSIVVHKSMKDLITFAQLHPYNVATQNESVSVFDDAMVQTINGLSTDVWLFYGSDADGVKKCKEVTDRQGWRYINTPRQMLPDVNDIYSYVKKHGLSKLEQFCKSKNLLK